MTKVKHPYEPSLPTAVLLPTIVILNLFQDNIGHHGVMLKQVQHDGDK